MAVVGLEIRAREPYAEGRAFGAAGAYERLDGTIRFAVDPALAANRAIVDLDRAPRDAEGRVHFQADVCLLQPADQALGSRRLLFEVLNRGRKLLPRQLNRAPAEPEPTAAIDPGDGFLMRHGWTIAWCGWQWDVVRSDALMGLEAPQALGDDGRPLPGQVLVKFQPNELAAHKLLADRVHQPYPAADPNDPDAVLTVQEWAGGPRTAIPRQRWRFARDEAGRAVADDTHVRLDGGFEPGRVYEVRYRTRICPVVGTGLLAVRDTPSFLRYDTTPANPCAGRIDHAFGFGMSQSGRFLRHFLYLGLNLDEQGRIVFDGVIPHVAGARRGEFNHRHAQPSVQNTPGFGFLFPFHDEEQTDPVTGARDGLLRRQRELGGLPKVFTINTSAEYWRGDCSLTHTDVQGTRDAEPPAEVRNYHFAGTQHGPGTLPLGHVDAIGQHGANGFNAVDYSPLLRAAVQNLAQWVTAGEAPPPSAFPRLADGTAARPADTAAAYRPIPGMVVFDPARLPVFARLDLGPDAEQGIARLPAVPGEPYVNYVSAVDADGNETAGIRLPYLTVPVATSTGWNVRAPETGGAGQILSMQGSTVPFAPTEAERQRAGDPRPAIEARYRDRADYLARVRAEAERLVEQRYLLAEDLDLVVDLAAQHWDAFAPTPVGGRP